VCDGALCASMRCGSILARGRLLCDAKSGPTTGCCWPVGDHVGSPNGESIKALHLCLLGDLQRVVHFDAEVTHCALELRVPQEKLYYPEVLRPSVYQRRFRPPQGVRAIGVGIESDFPNPAAHDPSILSRGQMRRQVEPTRKQVVIRAQTGGLDPGDQRIACLLGDLKLHRTLRLLLHHYRARGDDSSMTYVPHAQRDEIARP